MEGKCLKKTSPTSGRRSLNQSILERGAIQYASDYNRKAMDYSEHLSQEKSKNICRKIRNPWHDGYKSGMFAFCMNAGPLTKIFHEVEDVTIGQDDQMD